jgi:hypothetical protein
VPATEKADPMTQAQLITRATHGDSLADILERVLNTGLVIAGDIRIKLCDVELLSIQLRLLICSVEKARELGISWWWQTPQTTTPLSAKTTPLKKSLPPQRLDSPTPLEEYQKFHEFQRFREVMKVMEEGPR